MRASVVAGAVAVSCLALSSSVRVAPVSTTTPGTFKLAYYNIQSGMGMTQLSGTCSFQRNSNCTDPSQPLNAWGTGVVQAELQRAVGGDPAVIALGVSEAWGCAQPDAILNVLGWKAHTGERNGTTLLARHGFAGPPEWLQLDTSLNANPADTKWVVRAPVCADAACSRSLEVFSAHWYAGGATRTQVFEQQARDTAAFMDRLPPTEPRVLIGDLNVWEEGGPVCNQTPVPTAMQILRDAGYVDAWPSVHGTAEGYTGMWNRNGCGVPNGYLWKRIDQSWSKALPASTGMTRFGMVVPGTCAPSDHAGVIVEYPWQAATDTTAPTLSITAPAASAVVSGTVTVAAIASDDIGVTRVGFTIDGVAIGEDVTAPYSVPWSTTAVPNGAHTVGAWAEDAAGNRGTAVPVDIWLNNPPPNTPPTAQFISACSGLTCSFTDTSTDADGTIASWAWTFGDGTASSLQHPSRTYAAAGSYTVTLTVTDSAGATASVSKPVTVAAPFDFSLTATPSSRTLMTGAKTTYTVTTTVTGGSASPIALSVAGLPANTTARFSTTTLNGSGSSTLTVTTSRTTPPGTYPLTITGAGGGLSRTAGVTLVVRTR